MIGAFISGTMAISFGGAMYPWDNRRIIGLFCCSGACWIAFGTQQSLSVGTNQRDRLFPVETLRRLDMVILFVQAAASVACVFIPIYFLPLYFQFVRNDHPLQAAVRLLPFIFCFVFATVFNGIVMGKTGYYMPWYLGGGVMLLVGGVLMHRVDQFTNDGSIYGFSVIIAIGAGSFNQACWAVSQAKSDPESLPLASSLMSIANVGGLTLSMTISNSVFINKATNGIARVLLSVPRSTVQAAIAGVGGPLFESLDETERMRTLVAITDSISDVYILIITSGVTVVICALFMGRDKLFV